MTQVIQKIKLRDVIAEIETPFHPIEVARVNDHVVRVARIEGEYHWHKHASDELFYVLEGEIQIQLKDSNIVLKENEMVVIPKGVEHCPKSGSGAYILMFEPLELKSAGD